MIDGITHAIATCDRIERRLTDAAGRATHALAEMASWSGSNDPTVYKSGG